MYEGVRVQNNDVGRGVRRHAASVVQSAMILQARRLATDSQFWRSDRKLLQLVLGVTLESASPQKLQ